MAKWMSAACAIALVAVGSAGCKKPEKVASFVPPEPIVSPSELTDTTPSFDPLSTPERVVRPTYVERVTALPGDTEEAHRLTTVDSEGSGSTYTPVPAGGSYVVRKGDTLYALARRFYNDQRKWRVIYEANRQTLRDPNQIQVGQVLTIPAAE